MFIKENLTENDSRLGFSVTDFYVLTCTCIIRKSFLSLSHMIRFLMDRMKIIISNLKKQTFISLSCLTLRCLPWIDSWYLCALVVQHVVWRFLYLCCRNRSFLPLCLEARSMMSCCYKRTNSLTANCHGYRPHCQRKFCGITEHRQREYSGA